MGIQGLLPFVDGGAVDKHLSDFSGQTAAIDGYCWLRERARMPCYCHGLTHANKEPPEILTNLCFHPLSRR